MDYSKDSNAWIEKEVTFKCGSNTIFGILTLPNRKAVHPAIVLLHGSGREGVNYPFHIDHSHNLVQSGYAILRYDSPGVGKSTGSIIGENLETRTQEAISVVKYLQSREDIKPSSVGLWGISQGGWICQMAAAEYPGVAFIIPVSGPGVTVEEQEVYRVEMQSRADGFNEDEVLKAVLIRRLLVDIFLSSHKYRSLNEVVSARLGIGPWSELCKYVYYECNMDSGFELEKIREILVAIQEERWAKYLYLEKTLPVLDSISPEFWESMKSSYGSMMVSDPADHLTRVTCPVLAIFGEADTVLPVSKSVALYKKYLEKAGNEEFVIKVFPYADHHIEVDGKPANGYYETILDWLRARAKNSKVK
jgi:pimeloyl-ACP methyl ester carboxylesterase